MSNVVNPCLSLAISRLIKSGTEHFAIWVIHAPYSGGYVHHDCIWTPQLTQKWLAWQEMFSLQAEPHLPVAQYQTTSPLDLNAQEQRPFASEPTAEVATGGYGGRLMQELGVSLWKWLFDGQIRNSFAQSRGIAIGQAKPLRLRLEIRDPNLIPIPWEIMQPDAGKQAISLNQQLLFSRTTTDVDPLGVQHTHDFLNILLVLGQDIDHAEPGKELVTNSPLSNSNPLQLETEAKTLAQVIEQSSRLNPDWNLLTAPVPAHVHTVIQPTPAELIDLLDQSNYNVFFYAGHGVSAPDGGLLFLRPNAVMNGTELAQVLVRNQVTLAVFNACWGAQPDQQGQQSIERSSLAEVLIHHGVPAVLAMRDSIADEEALSFIQAFTRALAARMPIDQAVAIARQQLLTLYKFNQPAWTLPILYMHPEFEGELINTVSEGITELPLSPSFPNKKFPLAYLRAIDEPHKVWYVRGGLMRVGRRLENDLAIQERWVSQQHAEIICRETENDSEDHYRYFLRDFSRFGTLICDLKTNRGWQKIHHQEIPLQSGLQLKFGSSYGQTLEFMIENSPKK